jgi:hypothetical protein
MELALEIADWLAQRWWGKPFAWLIRGVVYVVAFGLLLVFGVLGLGFVVGILVGIGYGIATSNPLSATLFCTAVGLAMLGVVLWWQASEPAEFIGTGALAMAAVVAVVWVATIPDGDAGASRAAAAGGCHASYKGECLDADVSDYDCAGGEGNGPRYAGYVRVVGYDEFGLDRDGDGVGCE